jgi:hypothetical protein
MPIEFRCANCNQLLRTPDASAGKQARCPNCGQISPVPLTSPPPSPGPPPSPAPVNPFSETTAPPQKPGLEAPFNPYAAPAPQEKVVMAGEGGALTHQKIDIGDVLGVTWRVLTEDLGQCALMGLIYLAVMIGVAIVGAIIGGLVTAVGGDSPVVVVIAQLFNQTVSLLANTWVMLGVAAWSLKMLRTRQANINEFFSVGPYYLRGLGATLLFYVALLAPFAVLVGIGVGVGAVFQSEEAMVIGGVAGGIIALFIMIYLTFSFFLYYFFLVDRNVGILDSFRLSAEFTKGNKLAAFAIMMIVGIGGSIFALCTCYLGFILYLPYMMLVIAMIYLSATGQPHAGQTSLPPAKPIGPI